MQHYSYSLRIVDFKQRKLDGQGNGTMGQVACCILVSPSCIPFCGKEYNWARESPLLVENDTKGTNVTAMKKLIWSGSRFLRKRGKGR